MATDIQTLSIKQLFSHDRYVIPIYQRNYAWGSNEITQLIQDIVDYAKKDNQSNYYIGTLVVFKRKDEKGSLYETIDGQQRLTTLSILLSLLKRRPENCIGLKDWLKLNVEFYSRENSTETLEAIFNDTERPEYLDYKNYNSAIQQAYVDADKALRRILKENKKELSLTDFYKYLTSRVFILRVPVPRDTNLNHYFEIMNNRGEQLEKHEILKAKMLDIIKDNPEESYAFSLIWEACADMERYVQYGFNVSQRNLIFKEGNWNKLQYEDLSSIAKALAKNEVSESESEADLSISQIISSDSTFKSKAKGGGEAPDRFTSVTNFSNFLLHVLRVQTRSREVVLDDKRLIDIFMPYLAKENESEAKAFVMEFGYNILKCKFLFDKYVIKREISKDKDEWCVKRLKVYDKNNVNYVDTFRNGDEQQGIHKDILMCLAMFHVSTPTQVYKHWLNAVLLYLFENSKPSAENYLSYLENLARAFFLNRYLAKHPLDFYDIIYTNSGKPQETEVEESNLNSGTYVENFVFNYLDYLLWKNVKHDSQYSDSEFKTSRTSVEHYFPQESITGERLEEPDKLHHFGNLCLISSGMNSRLNNHMPAAKKDYYTRVGVETDSIKQRLMISEANWGVDEIKNHGEAMKAILLAPPLNLN